MARRTGTGREPSRAAARPPQARDESGLTLTEIMVAVWILGAVMVTMCGALFTMVRGSDLANRTAIAEAELRRYAEVLRAVPYVDCSTHDAYTTAAAAIYSAPASPPSRPVSATVQSVEYWDKNADGAGLPKTFNGQCVDDNGVQRLALVVTVAGDVTARTTITKRDNNAY